MATVSVLRGSSGSIGVTGPTGATGIPRRGSCSQPSPALGSYRTRAPLIFTRDSIVGTITQSIKLFTATEDMIVTRAIFRVVDAHNIVQPPNIALGTNDKEGNIAPTQTMGGVQNTGDLYSITMSCKAEVVKKGDALLLTIVTPAQIEDGFQGADYTMSCTIIGIPVNPTQSKVKLLREDHTHPIFPGPGDSFLSPKQILKQHRHANECFKEEWIAISKERIVIQCAKYEMLSTCVRWIATAATLSSTMYFFI